MSSAMTASHQMFLQAFMARGMLNAREVKELYKKCMEKFQGQYVDNEEERRRHLVEFIHCINSNIQPFHLDIKKGVSEEDGSQFYCLVNSVENNITRMSSDYTANELEFFKKLVERIVEGEGKVGSVAALNIITLERLEKKMSKNDAQDLLLRLENDRWIVQKEGSLFLSSRAILELDQYIREVYPDSVKICNVCKQICLKGQMCDDCGVKIHLHCAARFFLNQENPLCPDLDCRAPWIHPVHPLSNKECPFAVVTTIRPLSGRKKLTGPRVDDAASSQAPPASASERQSRRRKLDS